MLAQHPRHPEASAPLLPSPPLLAGPALSNPQCGAKDSLPSTLDGATSGPDVARSTEKAAGLWDSAPAPEQGTAASRAERRWGVGVKSALPWSGESPRATGTPTENAAESTVLLWAVQSRERAWAPSWENPCEWASSRLVWAPRAARCQPRSQGDTGDTPVQAGFTPRSLAHRKPAPSTASAGRESKRRPTQEITMSSGAERAGASHLTDPRLGIGTEQLARPGPPPVPPPRPVSVCTGGALPSGSAARTRL